MKTEQEVLDMKHNIQLQIADAVAKASACRDCGDIHSFEMYDRMYAKLTAQYNVLLEVLR